MGRQKQHRKGQMKQLRLSLTDTCGTHYVVAMLIRIVFC